MKHLEIKLKFCFVRWNCEAFLIHTEKLKDLFIYLGSTVNRDLDDKKRGHADNNGGYEDKSDFIDIPGTSSQVSWTFFIRRVVLRYYWCISKIIMRLFGIVIERFYMKCSGVHWIHFTVTVLWSYLFRMSYLVIIFETGNK